MEWSYKVDCPNAQLTFSYLYFGAKMLQFSPFWPVILTAVHFRRALLWDLPYFGQNCTKCLTKKLFSKYVKLFLEHQEENIRGFLEERINQNQFLVILPRTQGNDLKRLAICFQVAIQFYLGHLQPKITNTNSFALIRVLLLTKLGCYFNISIHRNMFNGCSK